MNKFLWVFFIKVLLMNSVSAQTVTVKVTNSQCEGESGQIMVSVNPSGNYRVILNGTTSNFSTTRAISNLPENTYRVVVSKKMTFLWFSWWSDIYDQNKTVLADDTQNPVFQNPQTDITVNAYGSSCGEIIDYTLPAATDNCTAFTGILTEFDYLGELNNHTYYYSKGTATATNAILAASNVGGHLVAITSKVENDFVNSKVGNIWIGLTDATNEGAFVWGNGEAVTFTNWNGSEPNDYGSGEDYTEIVSTGR